MKTLARVTGWIFVVMGLLAIGLGLFEILRGILQPQPFLPGLFDGAEAESMLLPLRFMVGGLLSLHGLVLAALGEGLWLLASMAQHSEKSSELLIRLASRG